MAQQKLELTWYGKENDIKVEPRLLIENHKLSFEYVKKGNAYVNNDDNLLIHGDNLIALKALENNFTGKIKCIVIDPPYNINVINSGEYDDNIPHSEWLTLMKARLVILRKLLSKDGVIWISIDDRELSYLTVLCNEIFGFDNFVACLPTIMNLKGNQDQFGFAGTHEYTLVYAKNKNLVQFNKFEVDEEGIMSHWEEDEIGYYKKGANLKATGVNAPRDKRPNLFFPIYVGPDNDISIDHIEGYDKVFPTTDEAEMSWRWSKNKIDNEKYNIIVTRSNNGISFYKKQRPELGELPSTKPKSVFYKPEYSSGNGTSQIKKIFGYKAFPYPKPEELIKDFILLSTKVNDYVLDSFLGSGTTAAVAHKLKRKWIGIELTDNAYKLCKVRLDKVISNKDKGGISSSVNWNGGGSYKFYELAPSLIEVDEFDQAIINSEYNADMLAAAIALHEGYKYEPDQVTFWKQAKNGDSSYLFTTTKHLDRTYLDAIHSQMNDDEFLVISCKSFESNIQHLYKNISIKKIPQSLLKNCEFGVDNYNLNIINPPVYEEDDEDE